MLDKNHDQTAVDRFLERCLFLDLETGPQNRIFHIGALFMGRTFERKGRFEVWEAVQALDKAAKDASCVLGHNLLGHDLPVLRSQAPGSGLLCLPVIDTLYLSPLAFPENPYHHLIKGYKLVRDSLNDPVADAELSASLFRDQWKVFAELNRDEQEPLSFYRYCFESTTLSAHEADPEGSAASSSSSSRAQDPDSQGLASVFKAVGAGQLTTSSGAFELFKKQTAGRVCQRSVAELVPQHLGSPEKRPMLAYALSWLRVAGGNSVLPPWVRHRFESIVELLRGLRDNPCGDHSCDYCSETHDPEKQLHRCFGFSGFRTKPEAPDGNSLQRAAVIHGMKELPLLAVLPTGSGKSLCYQVPALVRHFRRGVLTVVLSPLQALMKDQVDNLQAKTGSPFVGAVYGMLTPPERGEVLERVRLGDLAVLYVSPEQLRNRSIRNALLQREIGCWVFDEAHCLSKWGHDFRPDYLYATRFIRELSEEQGLPVPPVACFTATAKLDVINEITELFKDTLHQDLLKLEGGVERANLHYQVRGVPAPHKMTHVHELLTEYLPDPMAGSAIVYAATRKNAEELKDFLQEKGHEAEAFHAGLNAPDKRRIQDSFVSGDLPVICATNAFGMGIDKDNVRLVIHADIPGSLENYLQEAGRAGRDLKDSHCILLYCEENIETQFLLSSLSRLEKQDIAKILRGLRRTAKKYGDELVITTGELLRDEEVKTSFEGYTPMADTKVKVAVSWLERGRFLQRNQNRTRVFQGKPLMTMDKAGKKIAGLNLSRKSGSEWMAIYSALLNADVDKGISADELAELPALKRNGSQSQKSFASEETETQRVLRILHDMSESGLLQSGIRMTAHLRPKGKLNALAVFVKACKTEQAMLDLMRELDPDVKKGDTVSLTLDRFNQRLKDDGIDSSTQILQNLLKSLALDGKGLAGQRGSLELRHLSRSSYRIRFLREWQDLVDIAKKRRAVAGVILDTLLKKVPEANFGTKDVLVEFSSDDLTKALRKDMILATEIKKPLAAVDRGLMFLHEHKAIILQHGLAVFRQAMTIRIRPEAKGKRYLSADYEPLAKHYDERIFQVHAIKEYATIGVEKAKHALRLVMDYFTLEKKSFVKRYFPGRSDVIRLATTQESYQRIVDSLANPEQIRVVSAPANENMLILAGPGSGKTRVVVHRCAFLLRVLRVPAHRILVLCFNHNASITLRRRLHELTEKNTGGVTVLTYHAMAMHLTGTSFAEMTKTNAEAPPDFDKIIEDAVALLRGDKELPGLEVDEVRDRLLGGYSHILVDEYQDIDSLQYELVSALTGRTRSDPDEKLSILAVGDDDQNIYAFRGTNVGFIRRFQEEYKAKVHYLVENYRSSSNIISVSNSLIRRNLDRMKTDHPIRINEQREHEGPGGAWQELDTVGQGRVRLLKVDDALHQAAAIVAEIERLRRLCPETAWSSFAVLARTREALKPVRAVCEEREIPITWNVDRNKFPPLHRIREIERFMGELSIRKNELKRAGDIDKMLQQPVDSQPSNPWPALLRNLLGSYRVLTDNAELPVSHAVDFLYQSLAVQRRESPRGEGVFLSTAHSAKGMEFPHVLIPDGGWYAHANRARIEEDRRVYYVAMTRAMQTLTLLERNDERNPHISCLPREELLRFRVPPLEYTDPGSMDRNYSPLGMKELFIDFAGCKHKNHPIHKHLSELQPGSTLFFSGNEPHIELVTLSGHTVARLSRPACEKWQPMLPDVELIRVIAVIERNENDPAEEYRGSIRCKQWEVPIVEVVHRAR